MADDETIWQQLLRAVQAERDYVNGKIQTLEERLRGMDRATKLLDETVNRVPTDIQNEVSHLNSVIDERFKSIEVQFAERDTRSERESRDNKVAVDAAFAAQKEAAAKQDESNAKAIDKSEAATSETINKLNELFSNSTSGLSDKIDDLKGRIVAIEAATRSVSQSAQARVQGSLVQSNWTGVYVAAIAVLVTVVIAALATQGFTK